jgi:hypothetical protein
MFGKSWGIADEKTLDIFYAQFPPFLIQVVEFLKGLVKTDNIYLGRLISTTAGALIGFAVLLLLALVFHFILRDRKYIDSLRYTALTLIPIAVLNGTLSHAVKTAVESLESLGAQNAESHKSSIVVMPWAYFIMNFIFYLIALWVMGVRTDVKRKRRILLLLAGTAFMALYVALGLMVLPGEWNTLLPELQSKLGFTLR